MSDHLHEPDDRGDVVDQTEADLTEGPAKAGPGSAPLVGEETPNPGEPETATPVGSVGEYVSRDFVGPAGADSETAGTGRGTGAPTGEGAVPDEGPVPPTAPG